MRIDKKAAHPTKTTHRARSAAATTQDKTKVKTSGKAKAARSDEFESASKTSAAAQKKPTVVLSPNDFADRSLSDLLAQLQQVAHELSGPALPKIKKPKLSDAKADARQKKLEKLEEKTGLRVEHDETTEDESGTTKRRRFSVGLSSLEVGGETTHRSGPSTEGSCSKDTKLGRLDYQGRAAAEIVTSRGGSARLDARGLKAQGRASASIGATAQGSAHLEGKYGTADAQAEATARAFAEAEGNVEIGKNGVVATGEAAAGIEARAQASAQFQSVGIDLGGERLDLHGDVDAYVEAAARAEGKVTVAATLNPPRIDAEVGGKAFAGVKAGVEGHIGIGSFVTLEGHADAWAGAGAEAKGVIGYKDGHLRLSFGAGAAGGVGAGVGGSVDINVKAMASAALHGAGHLLFGSRFDYNPTTAVSNLRDIHIPLGEKVWTDQAVDSRRLAMQIVLATMTDMRPRTTDSSTERPEKAQAR
ncbi:MAG: hypothetical protein QM765_47170 [Myxococcales bacterium]